MGDFDMSAQTILLVEDEPLLREVTSEDLQDFGFEVVTAGDGTQAIEVLESGQVLAAMITDIRMPGPYDGWALAQRARELRPELPIIYLSGYSEAASPVENAVLVNKPYRPHELGDALGKVGVQ